ncbi:MAG: squalene/phytoene synthase family protein [Paludibacter sp.]
MDKLFQDVSYQTSRLVTKSYSSSFYIGVSSLDASIRDAIFSIYGFVRFADEIVDTFHEFDKEKLLLDFEQQYYESIEEGISLNPILNAFQQTVRKYKITDDLVQSFLKSMKSDLQKSNFNEHEIKEYIYGSADVVGLMCIRVFVNGDDTEYEKLRPYAMRLGSAFQKINFLRDLKHDTSQLHRTYFPILKTKPFNESTKKTILEDIFEDFRVALIGINQLPDNSRLGVYTAFLYYKSLTKRIQNTKAKELLQKRISIPNYIKTALLFRAYIYTKFFK